MCFAHDQCVLGPIGCLTQIKVGFLSDSGTAVCYTDSNASQIQMLGHYNWFNMTIKII